MAWEDKQELDLRDNRAHVDPLARRVTAFHLRGLCRLEHQPQRLAQLQRRGLRRTGNDTRTVQELNRRGTVHPSARAKCR